VKSIKATQVQRAQIAVAMKFQKKLAQDFFSLSKRCGKSEALALEAQGEIEVLLDESARIDVDEKAVKEFRIVNRAVADQFVAAMINFLRQMKARSDSAQQYTLTTSVSAQEKAARDLIEQVQKQFNPKAQLDIDEMVEAQYAKPEKEDEDKGEEATGEGSE
jgi:hypothetical protein